MRLLRGLAEAEARSPFLGGVESDISELVWYLVNLNLEFSLSVVCEIWLMLRIVYKTSSMTGVVWTFTERNRSVMSAMTPSRPIKHIPSDTYKASSLPVTHKRASDASDTRTLTSTPSRRAMAGFIWYHLLHILNPQTPLNPAPIKKEKKEKSPHLLTPIQSPLPS